MPVPNPEVQKAGVWSPYDLPSKDQYRVLTHLNEPGEPRLHLVVVKPLEGRLGLPDPHIRRLRSSFHGRLTDSANKKGWPSQVDFDRLTQNGWVMRCREEEKKHLPQEVRALGVTVWMLTDKGREAIAQYQGRKIIKERFTAFLVGILDEARRKAKLTVPPRKK